MRTETAKRYVTPRAVLPDVSHDSLLQRLDLAVRCRRQIQQAMLRADNQIGALERTISGEPGKRKDKKRAAFVVSEVAKLSASMVQPEIAAVSAMLRPRLRAYDKEIAALAKQLPVAEWALAHRGIGAIMLGLVIGEIGDLSSYANPAKVWKRMGLAVMPDGQRQRRVVGEEGIAHGFSPRRRAVMFVLGDCLIKQNKGEFRALYDERKAYETARLADKKAAKMIAHRRASRYMQKRFLRELWRAWNLYSCDTLGNSCSTASHNMILGREAN